MAAHAKDDQYENQVAAGVVEAERVLIEKGLTPKDAREILRSACSEELTAVMEPVSRVW